MSRVIRLLSVWCVLFGVSTAFPARGAEPKKAAVTDASQADQDFEFQGEYSGVIRNGYFNEWAGLQVVALGDGKFQAVEYRGGLPGNGWDQQMRQPLTGARQDGLLALAGGLYQIAIQNGQATVRDTAGAVLGQLSKIVRNSPTLGAAPPIGATVLFDGSHADHFQGGKLTDDQLLMIGTETKQPYRDFQMHLEFRTPYMPQARGQGRGNSGVYIQGRYEVQILDSFGLEGIENECGGIYKTRAPDLNMCLPPLAWQTYDLFFTAPRFDETGKKICDARLTVWHNGVLIHNNVDVPNKTGGGATEGPDARPIKLQDHGNPVHFRNIWIVDLQPPAMAQATVQPASVLCCRQPSPRGRAWPFGAILQGRRCR